jgi:REP element-mobilizing transposase RayT
MWLLTSTFYGNWLPGDERGFVGRVRDRRDQESEDLVRREHDRYGEECDRNMIGLNQSAKSLLKCDPIRINLVQAKLLVEQFQETAKYRGYRLFAVAVMANHVHWLVMMPEELHGNRGVQDFKSYGSRILNTRFSRPRSGTWWTSKGSARLKFGKDAHLEAIDNVKKQEFALIIWSDANAIQEVEAS